MARLRATARASAVESGTGLLVEGIRLAEEALAARLRLQAAIVSPRLERTGRGAALLAALRGCGVELWHADDRLVESLSDASSHQGVLILAERPRVDPEELVSREGPALLVLCDGIQDPGNLGSIVRIAEATGASGLLCVEGADPFRPRAARASAGSLFRLPVAKLTGEDAAARALALCRDRGLPLYGAAPQGGREIGSAGLPARMALVLGGEGAGISDPLRGQLAGSLSIPMRPPVESLNVAAAAAILLYEASKRPQAVRNRDA